MVFPRPQKTGIHVKPRFWSNQTRFSLVKPRHNTANRPRQNRGRTAANPQKVSSNTVRKSVSLLRKQSTASTSLRQSGGTTAVDMWLPDREHLREHVRSFHQQMCPKSHGTPAQCWHLCSASWGLFKRYHCDTSLYQTNGDPDKTNP